MADVHRWYRIIQRRVRPARMRLFLETFRPDRNTRILDLGGTSEFWAGTDLGVTLLNVREPQSVQPPFEFIKGDATALPFEDRSFDIVFSNSMIEHLGNADNQRRCAEEARRVGRKLWIQTPNRYFFIEPHYLTPFIHWVPPQARRRLLRNFSVWGWLTRPSQTAVDEMINEIRLLDQSELAVLFPDCEIERERILGLTKSMIAVRR
jgi:hypothetical protein